LSNFADDGSTSEKNNTNIKCPNKTKQNTWGERMRIKVFAIKPNCFQQTKTYNNGLGKDLFVIFLENLLVISSKNQKEKKKKPLKETNPNK
jgi:hypothetical protein